MMIDRSSDSVVVALARWLGVFATLTPLGFGLYWLSRLAFPEPDPGPGNMPDMMGGLFFLAFGVVGLLISLPYVAATIVLFRRQSIIAAHVLAVLSAVQGGAQLYLIVRNGTSLDLSRGMTLYTLLLLACAASSIAAVVVLARQKRPIAARGFPVLPISNGRA